MRTYTLDGLLDFILYLFEQEQEEILWDIWLTTDKRVSFKDFKSRRLTPIRAKKVKALSKEEEAQTLAKASQFIRETTNLEGGEANG